MTEPSLPIGPKLRIAGILLLCGLVVAIATLLWKSPLSILVFSGIGGLLVFAGMVVYLYSIVSPGHSTQ
jgi:hypothetical protein